MIKSPLERLHWLTNMKHDRSITVGAHKVALYLAERCNRDTGQCNPEEVTIAEHTGQSDRTVERGVARLREAGYISTRKVGKLNHYTLLMPDSGVGYDQDNDPVHPTAVSDETPSHPTAVSNSPDSGVENTRQRCRVEQGNNKVKNKSGAPSVTTAGKPPSCPHQDIVEIYHKTLPILPAVRQLTETRKRLLRTRWKEDPERQSLDWWTKYFQYVAESDFLTGKTNGTGDRPPFVADFEWLIRPSNFVKVIEGKYHRGAA